MGKQKKTEKRKILLKNKLKYNFRKLFVLRNYNYSI